MSGEIAAQRAVEGDERPRQQDEVGRQAACRSATSVDHEVLQHGGSIAPGRPHVVGHQPGERPLELLRATRSVDVGDPLDRRRAAG